ncbi:MAG: hypothetical protein PHU04_00570 [Candidatus Peribacteraceae bacterium]|nr:hypothetical protein [Candidatus Peribacteraceae bacterium]
MPIEKMPGVDCPSEERGDNEPMNRRDALKRQIATLFAASALVAGCSTASNYKPEAPVKREGPTVKQPGESVSETAPIPAIVIQDRWPSFWIYPEGFNPDRPVDPAVERAWDTRVANFMQQITKDSRFVSLAKEGKNPVVRKEVLSAGKNKGKVSVFVTWTVIE